MSAGLAKGGAFFCNFSSNYCLVFNGVNLSQMTLASDPAMGSEMQNKMFKTGQVVFIIIYY